MRARASTTTALGLALIALALHAQSPPAAVTYLELPDGRSEGRVLEAGDLRAAVDVNSRIVVDFDAEALHELVRRRAPQVLQDDVAAPLLRRLTSLEAAAHGLTRLPAAYQREVRLYERELAARSARRANPEIVSRQLEEATRERAAIAQEILIALQASLEARFEAVVGTDAAITRADQAIDPIYDDVPTGMPYNMNALGELVDDEIGRLEKDLEVRLAALEELALAVELRAHLVRTDGSIEAVALEGHNKVERCLETKYEKLDFSLSDEERDLLAQYEALVEEIRQARAEGAEILDAVQQAFEAQRLPILDAIDSVEEAVAASGDRLNDLVDWADADRLSAWADGPAKEALAATSADLGDFESLLSEAETDVQTLEELADLAGSLRGGLGLNALGTILNALGDLPSEASLLRALSPATWEARVTAVRALIAGWGPGALATLGAIEGPIKAWNDATAAIETLRFTLEPIEEGVRQALVELRGGAAAPIAAELPEPVGQVRREITSDATLDTEVELTRICGDRDEGDELRLSYAFYSGDDPLAEVGWTDTLRIQVFGWRARALASVALVRFSDASGNDRWEPTAPVSFLFSRRAWPKDGEAGLTPRGVPFSVGFSTMPLDFREEESVEMGLSATVGLFNNFALFGYGVNLQADEEGFWFLALRPFRLGGMFQPVQP